MPGCEQNQGLVMEIVGGCNSGENPPRRTAWLAPHQKVNEAGPAGGKSRADLSGMGKAIVVVFSSQHLKLGKALTVFLVDTLLHKDNLRNKAVLLSLYQNTS